MAAFLIFSLLHGLGFMQDADHYAEISVDWFGEWQFARIARESLIQLGASPEDADRAVNAIRMCIRQQNWYTSTKRLDFNTILQDWITNPEVQRFLNVNRFEGQVWFNAEAFATWEDQLAVLAVFEVLSRSTFESAVLLETLVGSQEILGRLHELEQKSGYKLDRLMEEAASTTE